MKVSVSNYTNRQMNIRLIKYETDGKSISLKVIKIVHLRNPRI